MHACATHTHARVLQCMYGCMHAERFCGPADEFAGSQELVSRADLTMSCARGHPQPSTGRMREEETDNVTSSPDSVDRRLGADLVGKKTTLQAFTFANNAAFGFCRMLESAMLQGVELTVLGWHEPWHDRPMMAIVLPLMISLLDSIADEQLVLYHDAYDTLYATGLEQFVARFLDTNGHVWWGLRMLPPDNQAWWAEMVLR